MKITIDKKDLDLMSKNIVHIINQEYGKVSDGDHTFDELYHHRCILTAALFNLINDVDKLKISVEVWKSKKHDDGSMFDGYFIVGLRKLNGKSATYHYPLMYWDLFKIEELDRAPKWDGHTPQDAIDLISDTFCGNVKKVYHYND